METSLADLQELDSQINLPLDGEFFLSNNKKFEETVIFVNFFGGTKDKLKSHINLINEEGYDAVAFNLKHSALDIAWFPPIGINSSWGLREQYTDQIESIFNLIYGKKIVYAFSNPAACAIEAISRRNAIDIKALICDSGPFVDLFGCTHKLVNHFYHLPKATHIPASVLLSLYWGPRHSEKLRKAVQHLPEEFPILSIRSGKDKLVPMNAIKDVFRGSDHLNISTLVIPDCEHLEGLKMFPSEYRKAIQEFLFGKN